MPTYTYVCKKCGYEETASMSMEEMEYFDTRCRATDYECDGIMRQRYGFTLAWPDHERGH